MRRPSSSDISPAGTNGLIGVKVWPGSAGCTASQASR